MTFNNTIVHIFMAPRVVKAIVEELRSWGFRLIGGRDEGLVLKVDKVCFFHNESMLNN